MCRDQDSSVNVGFAGVANTGGGQERRLLANRTCIRRETLSEQNMIRDGELRGVRRVVFSSGSPCRGTGSSFNSPAPTFPGMPSPVVRLLLPYLQRTLCRNSSGPGDRRSSAPQIDKEVKVKTASISVQDPAIAELKTRVADLEKLLAQLKPAPAPTPGVPAPAPPPSALPAPVEGVAFFGVHDASGAWSEKHFRIPGAGERPPQAGDEAIVEGSVNVRARYIVYGASGWTNQRAIGVLRRGDKVKIVAAKQVVEGFWWIGFGGLVSPVSLTD